MDELYFKKSKSKGIIYIAIWKRNKDESDQYLLSLGNAKTCYEKFVRLKELEVKDKQLTELKDKLSSFENL